MLNDELNSFLIPHSAFIIHHSLPAPTDGFEPPFSRLTIARSTNLSYMGVNNPPARGLADGLRERECSSLGVATAGHDAMPVRREADNPLTATNVAFHVNRIVVTAVEKIAD